MIDFGLDGKRVLVAGAGYLGHRAGMGRACSRRLAAAGALVACLDIDEGRATKAADEINGDGGTAIAVTADVTDPRAVRRAVDEVVAAWGGIDACVDIVGGAKWGPIGETPDEDWYWIRDNNLSHVFYLYRAVSEQMIAQRTGGSLVAFASVDGTVSSAYHAAYGAAKAGVISLTKSFSEELGRFGIRVNAVAPGNVGTGNEDQPEDEFGTDGINPLAAPRSRDIANAVLFLSSPLAARITGQTLVVDGGSSVKSPWDMTPERAQQLRGY
jgi:NAD(P)-dependent dehydrogenase (short-subunit alcohol dehydrogenase family)